MQMLGIVALFRCCSSLNIHHAAVPADNFCATFAAHDFILVARRAGNLFNQVHHVTFFVGAGVFVRHGISPLLGLLPDEGSRGWA